MNNRIFRSLIHPVAISLGRAFVVLTLCTSAFAETVTLAVPGPGTLSYLPVYLAKAIGADKAEGLDLKLKYFSGGPLAMRDMMGNNSDFLAIGLPAIAAGRVDNKPVIAIGQLSQTAMFVFLLRRKLRNKVHSISQLKGRRIGTSSTTSSQRSMGYMMVQYLLQRAGLHSTDVQFISTGQNRDAYIAAFNSATVDAILGDEPFASEMEKQGLAVRLADLYSPGQSSELLGGPIIHAALATREDIYANHPDTVNKVLHMFDRTLQWMATHTSREIVARLAGQPGFEKADGKLLARILKRNSGMFTDRTDWNPQAVATTEEFFHRMSGNEKEANLSFSEFVRDRPRNEPPGTN